MPNEQKNIIIGNATLSIGANTVNAAGGSLVLVGHIKGPISLETSWENYDIESEQQLGAIRSVATKVMHKIKFNMMESLTENWRVALRQPAAVVSGTPPNKVMGVGDPVEQYHQIAIVGKAVAGATGVVGVRTVTIWKAAVESLDAIQTTKGGEQTLAVTLNCLYDESITTTPLVKGLYFQLSDASIA